MRRLLFLAIFLIVGCKEAEQKDSSSVDMGEKCDPAPEVIFFPSQMSLNGAWSVASPNSTWNVWAATADGKSLEPVTRLTMGQTNRIPNVSVNGRYLLFYSLSNMSGKDSDPVSLSANIWMMDRKKPGDFLPITRNDTVAGLGSFGSARFEKDGAVYFDSSMDVSGKWNGTPSLSTNVWKIDLKDQTPVPLTKNTIAATESHIGPINSKGDKIAITSRSNLNGAWNAQPTIPLNAWVMNLDGSGRVPLTKNTKQFFDTRGLTWFPSGDKLALISLTALDGTWDTTPSNYLNIWTVNADGTDLKRITNYKKNHVQSIAVSPDGKKFLFRSTMPLDGSDNTPIPVTNVWIMDVDGSNVRPLTRNTKTAFHVLDPKFSPDGTKVSFFSKMDLTGIWDGTPTGSYNLWVMNVDGTGLVPMTRNSNTAFDNNVSNQHVWSAVGANCK